MFSLEKNQIKSTLKNTTELILTVKYRRVNLYEGTIWYEL